MGRHTVGGVIHGFVLRKGAYTSIHFPGSLHTQTTGINARGDVVGGYLDADGVDHGFLLDKKGDFASLEFPSALFTRAFGINAQGDIVGDYLSEDFILLGFLLTKH